MRKLHQYPRVKTVIDICDLAGRNLSGERCQSNEM